jgi:S1-C subfamily serine protease
MTIAAAGSPRIPEGTSATKGFLRTDRAGATTATSDAPHSDGRVGPATIGLLAGGGLGLAGGLALRGMGHGRIGTAIAAIGGALLGASLLTACGPTSGGTVGAAPTTPRRTDVPGDEGEAGDDLDILGTWTDLPAAGSDATNPAPANWLPSSGTLDAREGVVQFETDTGLGSGWVVEPGKVITNYHVAQGARDLDVIDHRGETHRGTVQRLDRSHDLALVTVPTLADAALPMDDVVEDLEFAETTGYPGGYFHNDAATAVNLVDIVDDGRPRDALMLLGESEQGVSGGAVINGAGEVVGTSFAVGSFADEEDPLDFVLAIPNDQVRDFLARASN